MKPSVLPHTLLIVSGILVLIVSETGTPVAIVESESALTNMAV